MESRILIRRAPPARRENVIRFPQDTRHGPPPARRGSVRIPRQRYRRGLYPLAALLVTLMLGFWLGWFVRGFFLPAAGAAAPGPDGPEAPVSGLDAPEPAVPSGHKEPPVCPDWITQDFLTVNPYSRPGTPLETVNGVVVHYVGNPGTTARQNRSYFQNLADSGETYASSHFLVGLEGEIIQNIPLDEIAYCSNERNDDTISVECCHPDSDGAFTQATYDSLVRLVKWLREYYGLDTSQVIRHYDVVGKECPRYFVRNPGAWEGFLAQLET